MSVVDLSDVVGDLLATGSYTVVRTADNTLTNGRLATGSTSTFTITASVQPASGKDVERLPEGLRANESIVIFTPTELHGADGAAGVPDQIQVGGRNFAVARVEDFTALGNYYRVTATRGLV